MPVYVTLMETVKHTKKWFMIYLIHFIYLEVGEVVYSANVLISNCPSK